MIEMTNRVRLALREFKERINEFNFTINHQEPPFPVGSIESYKAQLSLANEYLEKYPELNNENFNSIGTPLWVRQSAGSHIKQAMLLQGSKQNPKSEPLESAACLLWDAYMVLDHGDHDERLAMLERLKGYFDRVGQPPLTKK